MLYILFYVYGLVHSHGYIVISTLPYISLLNHSQTNSLVEPPPQQLEGIPEYEVEEDNNLMDKQVETQMTSSNNFPPHVYDNGMSIMSKFSDVTTPTQHDGFELDEIVERKEKTMPQLLSPVAEAAASSASTNGTLQHLPCIIVEMSEEESSNEEKDSELISSEIEKEERRNDDNKATEANLKTLDLIVEESEVAVPCFVEEEDTDKFVTVAKQEDLPLLRDNNHDITELMEVTSILSQYEEKAESARKEKEKAFWEKMDQEAKARQRAKSDDVSEPFDEEKKVRFLEDQAVPHQEAVCGGNGCIIQ